MILDRAALNRIRADYFEAAWRGDALAVGALVFAFVAVTAVRSGFELRMIVGALILGVPAAIVVGILLGYGLFAYQTLRRCRELSLTTEEYLSSEEYRKELEGLKRRWKTLLRR